MTEIKYNVIRSKRKSISAAAGEDGILTVRAPLYVTDKDIADFIEKYRNRITDMTEKALQRSEKRNDMLSAVPKEIPYRGSMTKVEYTPPYGYYDGVFHLPEKPLGELIYGIKDLYRQTAKTIIIPRARFIAYNMKARPSNIRITNASKRWGSCSGKGSINFTAKLAAVDDECVKYVIVHELCHLTYMDHSKEFWAMVEKHLPDYRESEKRLERYNEILCQFGLD